MNNDIAVEILRELWRYKTTDKYTEIEIRRALETAIEAVNGLRQHGEWVPCTERLPEEMKDVLVWYEYFSYKRNKMVQTYGIGNVYKDFWCGDVQGTRAKCIAWMPLPERYKKEGEAE